MAMKKDYPDQYPQEASDTIVGMINGSTPLDAAELTWAIWEMAGFGLNQVLPAGCPDWGAYHSQDSKGPGGRDAKEHVLHCLGGKDRAAIDWTTLVPALVSILTTFIPNMPGMGRGQQSPPPATPKPSGHAVPGGRQFPK